jgi:hypothetical protein
VILIIGQKNQLAREIEKHTCIDVYIEEYYITLEMLEIESEGGVDIDDVNMEQGKNSFELIETVTRELV